MTAKETVVLETIKGAWQRVVEHQRFIDWLAAEKPRPDHLVIVNNSFIHRGADIGTPKSDVYLAIVVRASQQLSEPAVLRLEPGQRAQNLDFRHTSQKGHILQSLDACLPGELKNLGALVFSLIGTISNDLPAETEIGTAEIKRIVWDVHAKARLQLLGDTVTVKDVEDEGELWEELVKALKKRNAHATEDLKGKFARALDNLQGLGKASLSLPGKSVLPANGVLDQIISALKQQDMAYRSALSRWNNARSNQTRVEQFNEVLRIAYAFAGASTILLRLIVSICDLKPIILWTTIDKHFALSESIRELPWSRSKDKPSLKNYSYMIGDARNQAFHDVLPFDRALNLKLPPRSLTGAEITFFAEYGSDNNEFTFDDKQLAEVLLDFTRSRRRPTPEAFWTKNAAVISAIIEVVASVNAALKQLHAAIHGK